HPEFLGQAERHAQGHLAEIVFLAAETIAAHRVARPDASALKAAQVVAADKEPVLNKLVLSVPSKDITGLAGDAQNPFGEDRVVVPRTYFVAHIIHPETDPSEVIADGGIIAGTRIQPIVAAVVKQNLTDLGGRMLTGLQHDEQRCVGL